MIRLQIPTDHPSLASRDSSCAHCVYREGPQEMLAELAQDGSGAGPSQSAQASQCTQCESSEISALEIKKEFAVNVSVQGSPWFL